MPQISLQSEEATKVKGYKYKYTRTHYFENLISYQLNIKLIIEKKSAKVLDAEIIRRGCKIDTNVFNKSKKVPVQWSSKTLATYKCNTSSGALHRAKKIATDFNYDVKRIFQQFLSAGFLRSFIRTTVNISIQIKMTL